MEYRQHTPGLFASASSSRACDSVTVKGLSTTTCLPASSAALANGKWVSLGVGMTIRSMLGSLNRCFGSETTVTVGQSAFTFVSSLLEITASSSPACPQSGAHGRFCSHNHTQSTQHGCCRSCHCLSLKYDGYLTLSFTHAQQFNNLPAIRDVV